MQLGRKVASADWMYGERCRRVALCSNAGYFSRLGESAESRGQHGGVAVVVIAGGEQPFHRPPNSASSASFSDLLLALRNREFVWFLGSNIL